MGQVTLREKQVTTRCWLLTCDQDSKSIKQVKQLKKIGHKEDSWTFFNKATEIGK